MIALSVTERIKETNTDRIRIDGLDQERALYAVARIGASLVFGRKSTIAIPDSEIQLSSDSPLDIAEVLPDWSAADRTLLLTRPVFDPATLGRARLHNDNEGVVRSYLTARWLASLRAANLATRTTFDLLFAKSYGLNVIKPSLNETAAWLSLWDSDVAREVVRRSPLLLLTAGDPASLSVEVRRDTLVRLIEELVSEDHEWLLLDNDKLRRFAQPDLADVIPALWLDHGAHPGPAQLLLRLVWLGALKGCGQLASNAAFETNSDSTTRVLAGRALLVTCDERTKRRYATQIMNECSTLPKEMMLEAFEDLLPDFLTVGDLLSALNARDITDGPDGLDFARIGPQLVRNLTSFSEVEQLLSGLLAQLGGYTVHYGKVPTTKLEDACFPAIVAAAERLLKISPPDLAPEAAVDAVLRLGSRWNNGKEFQAALSATIGELHRTISRRRRAFWLVAERLGAVVGDQRNITDAWQMEMCGYPPGLGAEDIDWLLNDGLKKGDSERRLAINSAMAVQEAAASPNDLLQKIEIAARKDALASEAYDSWIEARQARSVRSEAEEELEKIERENAAELAKRDQSWLDFIQIIRADPARIAKLKSASPTEVNFDLVRLWDLLRGNESRSKWAIDDITPLELIAGREIAEAVREGLMEHWRNSVPLLRSQTDLIEPNSTRWVDLMGITGVTLEAATKDGWAEQLTSREATLAAYYSTLEANSFPDWLPALAMAKPREVREVLLGEISAELSYSDPSHYNTLGKVVLSDDAIAALLAPALLNDLSARAVVSEVAVSNVLRVIVRGICKEQARQFIRLGIDRFENDAEVSNTGIIYLAAVFSLDPETAITALATKLDRLNADDRTLLMDVFLCCAFGNSFSPAIFKPSELTIETLEQVVRMSFREDRQTAVRPAGTGYPINRVHDRADQARSGVFNRFANTPGPVTFRALLELKDDPACPIAPIRLRALAEERAIQDSESAPWPPAEAFAFEQSCETSPRTPKDLQTLALSRIEDMEHDLLQGDFSQAVTVRGLQQEVDVQNWVADRLRLKQGRSYSVEREPHVVEEKKPDVRFRAKATDASVPMEIKVAEAWCACPLG